MKKLHLFFLFFTTIAFAQNTGKDTLLNNGSQQATILKISQHKLIVKHRSAADAPYILQKDGSFISARPDRVQISVVKSKKGNPREYLEYLFQMTDVENGESKSVAPREEYPFYIRTSKKGDLLIFDTLYAMKNELLSVQYTVKLQSPKDEYRINREVNAFLWDNILIYEKF